MRRHVAAASRAAERAGELGLAAAFLAQHELLGRAPDEPGTDLPSRVEVRIVTPAAVRLTLDAVHLVDPVGPHLRAIRESVGIAAAMLADAMGVSPSRVRGLEDQRSVRVGTVARYLEALRFIFAARAASSFAHPNLMPAPAITANESPGGRS